MIKYSRIKRIHFVGIGGAGMSGIAEVLHNMGFSISGSDIAENSAVKRFQKMGVPVHIGHRAENLGDAQTLVYSSAIRRANLEVQAALERKIPVIPRAEMLAELMRVKFAIAVAGTHGKTTTTSMIATVLSHAQKDPTFVVGGKLRIEESGAKLGKSDYLIAEADESDGSFLRLFPSIAVITNIEDDHLDHYGSMEKLLEAFAVFGNKVPFYGSVVINGDCPGCSRIMGLLNKKVKTFGLSDPVDFRATDIKDSIFGVRFSVQNGDEKLGTIKLNVGGFHNVMNALAAVAVCLEISIPFDLIQSGLESFYLPERRFQVLYKSENLLVVDDYAHHPTEIKATLDTMKKGGFKRVFAVFQPHRFTRLELLMERFARAFAGIDQLIISRIYSANQTPIPGVDGGSLARKIAVDPKVKVKYIAEFPDIVSYLNENLRDGDGIVFLSAGDLSRLAHEFAAQLEAEKK